MKKLLIFPCAIAILIACQKEDQTNIENPNISSKSSKDYSQYEVFNSDTESDPVTTFSEFLNASLDDISGEYPINEAVWLLEGSTNYYFRKKLFSYDSLSTETYTFQVNIGEDMISAEEIKSVSESLLPNILTQIGSIDNALQVADVYITNIDNANGLLDFKVDAIVGNGVNYSFSTPLPTTASEDRNEFSPLDCNGNSKPNTGFDYVELLAHNKVINNTSIPSSKYHFYFNVIRYWDPKVNPNKNNLIDGKNLFARPNDIFPPSSNGDCLPKNEINGYTNQVYNDVMALLNPGDEIAVLDVAWDAYLCCGGGYFWKYKNVKVSLNHLATPGLAPSYLGEL